MKLIHLWKARTDKERKEFDAQRAIDNQRFKEETELKRSNVILPDTMKHAILEEHNQQIDIHNRLWKEAGNTGNKGTKRLRKSEQIWRYKEDEIGQGYGINYKMYINDILLKKDGLYDFVQATQARNSHRQIYLIEDNTEAYRKISRLLTKKRERRDIMKIDWVLNSPELHLIENIWGPLQDYLQPTWNQLNGSSDAVKEKAHEIIKTAWTSKHIQYKACEAVERWRGKLLECIKQGGKNNFKG